MVVMGGSDRQLTDGAHALIAPGAQLHAGQLMQNTWMGQEIVAWRDVCAMMTHDPTGIW